MLYLNDTKYNLLFIALITLFLLIDLGQFFLIGTTAIPLLLCAYCALLCCTTQYMIIALIALLQCLEFFCFYNFFFLACIYIIPTTILALLFKKYLYPSPTHIIALASSGIFIQIYAIEGCFLHIWPTNYYTIMRISATLLISIFFSLTINIWGMQDNRA
jgi:hypothetical protein